MDSENGTKRIAIACQGGGTHTAEQRAEEFLGGQVTQCCERNGSLSETSSTLPGSRPLDDARALEAEEQRLLELIQVQQANGVTLLAPSGSLSVAAERHSEDMVTYAFLPYH